MLLTINNLYKSFGSNQIFQNFNLSINHGDLIVIKGNNGCGKSTLFNLICGSTIPDLGSIFFDGHDIKSLKSYQISRRGIAKTFQNGGLIQELTVTENLLLTLESQRNSKWYTKILPINYSKHKNTINNLLTSINLQQHQNTLASSLSTGQLRLLELKKLQLQSAKLYLIDEPTAGVNESMYPKILELIQQLNQKSAVIIIEHNIKFIKSLNCKEYNLSTK